jgi:hypothetical protein
MDGHRDFILDQSTTLAHRRLIMEVDAKKTLSGNSLRFGLRHKNWSHTVKKQAPLIRLALQLFMLGVYSVFFSSVPTLHKRLAFYLP